MIKHRAKEPGFDQSKNRDELRCRVWVGLGEQLVNAFDDFNETELQNRIRAAWAKFMSNKQEPVSKAYSLSDRLRLFDA